MSTLRFEQRTDKLDQSGLAPIRIVYQVSGQRKYLPTTLKCLPPNWNGKEQQAVFIDKKAAARLASDINYETFLTATEVKEFNSKLTEYQTAIADIEKLFSLKKENYTPQMVCKAFSMAMRPQAKKDNPEESLVAFIEQFVRDSAGSLQPGTLKEYTTLKEHLAAFQRKSGRKATFDNINYPFLKGFLGFLTQDRTVLRKGKPVAIKAMNNTTAAKQLSTLKSLLNYARTHYKINVNPDYRDYRISRKDSDFEVITLTNEEFLTLFNLDLTDNKKLAQVRDVFCFSCATGLRYSDLAQLKREHIRGNVIKMNATKTGQRLEIPLNPFSATILEKYSERHRPLPVISNQKTNAYIKELCKKAGFDTPIEKIREYGTQKVSTFHPKYKLLSIHTGRRTFTTLSLEKGIAAQDVMAITGHTSYKSFNRYVNITSNRRQVAMAQAWGEL